MKRSWPLWIGFALCLAVVLAAMGWVSLSLVRLDRAESEAQAQAALEQKVRLALWRADSALAPLVARENVRPSFAYTPFFPADRGYSRMLNRPPGQEMLSPSPLLTEAAPYVMVHFQFESDGRLSSPQAPTGSLYRLAVPRYLTEQKVRDAQSRLEQVGKLVDRPRLAALLPAHAAAPVEVVMSPPPPGTDQQLARRQHRADVQQRGQGAVEFDLRNEALQQNVNAMAQSQQGFPSAPQSGPAPPSQLVPSTDLSGVAMTPLWIGGQLLLARRVTVGGHEYVQGCLLDWPTIKVFLLETVEDLLPQADFQPEESWQPGPKASWYLELTSEADEAHRLAALPVRLVASLSMPEADGSLSPMLLSLSVAWTCVLLAAGAVAGLLAGVLRLGQRRAAFVSAVTHELRTPLTTFQMYAEMLAEGMVPDPAQQRQYLDTLRAEAQRLTHLVENVLAYARLERGRAGARLETVRLQTLLAPVVERLAGRARQAGMELLTEHDEAENEAMVCVNPAAVEQVLFNLVDNACKYAAGAEDKRIHLAARCADGRVEISVRDHGPGVPIRAQGRLFRLFAKSAHEAARTAPGIGLGLVLSRRLARDMGGDLRLAHAASCGACFLLSLKRGQDYFPRGK